MTGDDGKTLLARAAVRIVTIGPTTSAAVREAGFHAAAEASAPDADAVARAVVAALAG
jgi:uroporphyrinogen-III synthase